MHLAIFSRFNTKISYQVAVKLLLLSPKVHTRVLLSRDIRMILAVFRTKNVTEYVENCQNVSKLLSFFRKFSLPLTTICNVSFFFAKMF